MNTKTLNNINQNIVATEELIERYENEKEKIKSKVVPAWQLYSGEIIGCSFAIAIVSANILDLGAMIIGVMGGAAIGASVPYIVKQIKIGDLNYQIFTNGLIYSDSIVEDFNRYNEYFQEYILPEMTKLPAEIVRQSSLKGSFVTFSDDQYHLPIAQEVIQLYLENGYGLKFDGTGDHSVEKDNLLKSGYSKQGHELLLEDNCIRMFGDSVIDTIYLTAKGNLSCYGDGSYEFIDSVSKDYPVSRYTLEQFCLANLSASSRDYDDSDRKSFVFFKKR